VTIAVVPDSCCAVIGGSFAPGRWIAGIDQGAEQNSLGVPR